MLYPQYGDRIVTMDSVTSLHYVYYKLYVDWSPEKWGPVPNLVHLPKWPPILGIKKISTIWI